MLETVDIGRRVRWNREYNHGRTVFYKAGSFSGIDAGFRIEVPASCYPVNGGTITSDGLPSERFVVSFGGRDIYLMGVDLFSPVAVVLDPRERDPYHNRARRMDRDEARAFISAFYNQLAGFEFVPIPVIPVGIETRDRRILRAAFVHDLEKLGRLFL